MAAPQYPDPVKLIVAILWADVAALERAHRLLVERWGETDFVGPDQLFDKTDYYAAEMGPRLWRRLVSFTTLVPPESVKEAKVVCNRLEDELAGPAGRTVNLDVGYLDHNKLVLASCKPAGQKIHLGDGIYADLIARYAHGRYQPFEWTFPDFKDGGHDPELAQIRAIYLRQRKKLRSNPGD